MNKLIIVRKEEIENYKINESRDSKFPFLSAELEDENLMIKEMLKNKKLLTDEEFGFYFAGLIEGDGSVSSRGIEIVFHLNDISLAYYLKNKIGFGNIYKIKNEKAVKYSVFNYEGVKKILFLVNGKFYSYYKIEYLKKHNYEKKYNIKILPPLDYIKNPLNNNHFLSGFADSDGNFSIFITKSKTHKTKKNVQLVFRISQKDSTILNIIIKTFGGNISTWKNGLNDINCYNSTSFKIFPKIIKYFDKYNLLSTKFINYIKWKKATNIILKKEHLTIEGLKKFKEIKDKMNNNLFK